MTQFEACRMVEAFRCGVPSRDIGASFSSARRDLIDNIKSDFDIVAEAGAGGSYIIGGRYGEGKTHMLNTIKDLAEKKKMAYSFISLGKETPMNNLAVIYQKAIENLYLPGIGNPGFFREIENRITLANSLGQNALDFACSNLKTDRLYYVFKTFLGSKDADDQFLLQSDLEGTLATLSVIKSIYSKNFGEKITFRSKFLKTKNMPDYFAFVSHLLRLLGYKGWVILFDEAELIGRMAFKSRIKAYLTMSNFLLPDSAMGSVYSVFAFSSSFIDEVINSKGDKDNVSSSGLDKEQQEAVFAVIDAICAMTELSPLTESEFAQLAQSIVSLHETAYSWHFNGSTNDLINKAKDSGYLLRTKIRASLEYLDQYYLYGNMDYIRVGSLNSGSYEEDVSLEGLFADI